MSVVTALAVLAAIGLLFALDPGGAIAESGLPEFQEMGWKQLVVWGLRTIGVVLAQLVIIVLWLWPKYRPPQTSTWYSETPNPESMPAAAVSALQGHAIWTKTMLASIIEMCQRGTLRIEAVGTRVGFLYQLSRLGPAQYDWERTICNSLPSRATTVDALRERIDKHSDVIGDQIGDYLQQRGFFHDNPVRVRRENSDDGGTWWIIASILTGVGSGFWAALWLDAWWANALIGVFAGLVYSFVTVQMTMPSTGMLKPTPEGALEISQWLGWKASMAGSAPHGAWSQSDPMLPYAVAFDVAQPWLDVAASAPPWFGSRGESSLPGDDLDAAYRAFMHAPEWWLAGRSEDAAKAAAQWGHEEELKLLKDLEQLDREPSDSGKAAYPEATGEIEATARELESQRDPPAAAAASPSAWHQTYGSEWMVEEKKGGGCLRGCLLWVVGLVSVGGLILAVVAVINLVSPAVEPCPADSPGILHHGQLLVVLDLVADECVSVVGEVASRDVGELVVEVDRDEYVQWVRVIGPADILEQVPVGGRVHVAGRIGEHADGGYVVRYGVDRGWWGNLRENLKGLF